MSSLLKNHWQAWARDWGVTHLPEKGWVYRTERVLGMRKDLLFRVSWGRDEDPGLHVIVRFPQVPDVERLRAALVADTSLDTLPGKASARSKMQLDNGQKQVIRVSGRPDFLLGPTSLLWRRTFSLQTPKPAQAQAWVEALLESVARATPGFDGHCEFCYAGQAKQFVVVDELPMMMCSTCQQRLKSEGDMAEREYEMSEAHHVNGFLLALVACVVGAVVWAGLAALTQRIFAVVALGMGALVAWAYKSGAGRVDLAGRVIAAALTLMSVALGEVMLYAIWISQGSPELGFSLEAGWNAYLTTWARRPAEEIVPVFFSLVGAGVAIAALAKPKLAAKVEAAGEPPAEEEYRKAA